MVEWREVFDAFVSPGSKLREEIAEASWETVEGDKWAGMITSVIAYIS